MGFLDLVKNLFGKKGQPPSSPSEQGQQKVEGVDGQFGTPQNPVGAQMPTPAPAPQAPKEEKSAS